MNGINIYLLQLNLSRAIVLKYVHAEFVPFKEFILKLPRSRSKGLLPFNISRRNPYHAENLDSCFGHRSIHGQNHFYVRRHQKFPFDSYFEISAYYSSPYAVY
jgi:hypothetical protein